MPKEEQTPEQYVAQTLKRAEDVVSGESFTVSGFDAYLCSLNVDDGKYTVRMIGIIYVIGRIWYAWGYVQDPGKRSGGFAVTFLANQVLVLGGLIGALLAYVR